MEKPELDSEIIEEDVLSPMELVLATAFDQALVVEDNWSDIRTKDSLRVEYARYVAFLQYQLVHLDELSDEPIELANINREDRRILDSGLHNWTLWVEEELVIARETASKGRNLETAKREEQTWIVNDLNTNLGFFDVDPKKLDKLVEGVANWTAELFDTTVPQWVSIYEHGREALASIYGHFVENPADLINFVEWVETQPSARTPEVQALFILLSNDINDKLGDHIHDDLFDKLRRGEVLLNLRADYLRDRLADADGETNNETSISKLLNLLRHISGGSDEDFIQTMLNNSELWVSELSDDYNQYFNSHLSMLKTRITEALTPDERRSRFEQFISRETSLPQSKSNKKAKRSRVTPAKKRRATLPAPSKEVGPERRVFSGYGRTVKAAGSGYIIESASDDDVDNRLVDYANSQDKDPRVLADLRKVLESITEQPYGNGASVYTDTKITIGGDATRLWHLSTEKRQGLSIKTETAKRTRIIYCVLPDEDNGFSIAIHRIRHHNDIGRNTNTMRRGIDY
jgi:hypothetical protein